MAAVPISVRKRQRRTFLFQGVIRNEKPDEPFGILGLTVEYTVHAPVRRRGG